MSKKIPLSQGKVAIVDNDDFEWLNQWKWCASKSGRNFYAHRCDRSTGVRKTVKMHRAILGLTPGDGIECDHVNRNGLDNRRANLRIATATENLRNCRKRKDNTSGYMGVTWQKSTKKWEAQIMVDSKQIHLGGFDDPLEAARAYDLAALAWHGEFATTNFQEE